MTVLRIVANIATDTVPDIRKFYSDLFGLDAVMDLGWIVTLASRETALPPRPFGHPDFRELLAPNERTPK